MIQVIKQTRKEKIKMYMKVPKKKLIEMLINCNEILDGMYKDQKPFYYIPPKK